MQSVEFGYSSLSDKEFEEYVEDSTNITQTVGEIPVSVLETIFENIVE